MHGNFHAHSNWGSCFRDCFFSFALFFSLWNTWSFVWACFVSYSFFSLWQFHVTTMMFSFCPFSQSGEVVDPWTENFGSTAECTIHWIRFWIHFQDRETLNIAPPLLHWSICTSIIVGSSTNNVSIVVVNPCGSYPDIAFAKELTTTFAACVFLAERLATFSS